MSVERRIERLKGGRSPEPGELTDVKERSADVENIWITWLTRARKCVGIDIIRSLQLDTMFWSTKKRSM